MGFVFHIFPGKRGKLRLQAQCITQIKALPEVSFGRVLQSSIDISLFQRAFRNFSAVSGVGCRSLRNLFAQNQRAGVAARKVQSAGLFVLAAQLFDGHRVLRPVLPHRKSLSWRGNCRPPLPAADSIRPAWAARPLHGPRPDQTVHATPCGRLPRRAPWQTPRRSGPAGHRTYFKNSTRFPVGSIRVSSSSGL
mgnify:CR=1 FL=1